MKFDRYTITLLILRPDALPLDEQAENELQDVQRMPLALNPLSVINFFSASVVQWTRQSGPWRRSNRLR